MATKAKRFQPDCEVHITLDDQKKINKFATNIARLEEYKQEFELEMINLKNLEEANDIITTYDFEEDEMIQYLIGSVFICHDLKTTQELLKEDKRKKELEIKIIADKCHQAHHVIKNLKTELYDRFGDNISLE